MMNQIKKQIMRTIKGIPTALGVFALAMVFMAMVFGAGYMLTEHTRIAVILIIIIVFIIVVWFNGLSKEKNNSGRTCRRGPR